MDKLKFIEEELVKLPKLTFYGCSEKFDNLEDFLSNFDRLNKNYQSYNGDTKVSNTSKWRSFSDIYCHANFFFKTSFEEIVDWILNNKSFVFIPVMCFDINKCVLRFEPLTSLSYFTKFKGKDNFRISRYNMYGNGTVSELQDAIYYYIDEKLS